jgi:tetratricopeptide (TPR) repeat protein
VQTLLRPVRLNVDHDVAVSQHVTGSVAAAIAVHVAVIVAAVRAALRGRRLFPLCVGWFWAFSVVTFVIPLNVVMNEHRLYMPMIAVALCAGAALARVAELVAGRLGSFGKGAAVAAAPLVCFVPLLVQRAREWRDDESLWTIAVERAPLSAIAHMNLGAAWHQRANGEFDRDERVRLLDKALDEYAKSVALHPARADVHLDIGNARLARGKALHDRDDFEKALAAYVRFGEIIGVDAARPRILKATALMELGEYDAALALARQAKSEDKSVTTIYDDLVANILRRKGDKAGAAEAMERVIAIEEPIDRVDGLLQLGWWLFEDGDLVPAERYLKRALAIARRSHDRRPPLYVIRFLNLVGQGDSPTVDEMEKMARTLGWTAPPEELKWALGGATPGAFTGTAARAGASR